MNPGSAAEPIAPELLAKLKSAAALGQPFWEQLEERLAAPRPHCLARLGATLRLAVVDMEDLFRLEPEFAALPYAEAVRRNCLLARDGDRLVGVVGDPFDLALTTLIETRSGAAPAWRLAHGADLRAYFAVIEDRMRALDALGDAVGSADSLKVGNADLSLESIARDESPVVRLVNSTIFDAMKAAASDIHLESTHAALTVKYRIDGVLGTVVEVPGTETAAQVVSRIKVMAELDIAERRIPQDGRFKLSVGGREVDFRVSVMPSLFGEDVVIRILDKRALTDRIQALSLDHLGFDAETLVRIRRMAREPYGMMLVTGPTGSGKTTTLYAALTEINSGQDKIVTIEDPIEYQLPGILQIPVNEKKGLGFSRGLRSILRHDPDKILVGEIRDAETAQIAIQSALTGHLVFTSVHANNVFDVLGRFLHMGVEPYSFVSALNGVLAQRLVRIVCPECATPVAPGADELRAAGVSPEMIGGASFRRGRGCGHCRGTGYKGRRAIGEVLRFNDELREMIVARAPIRAIKEVARGGGTRLLRDAALAAAVAGLTTLDEVNRVTFAD